ncbi:MAG: 8-amino-7-oxononanoate synthase [Muribaculaceae bacterium]|nr:8-amino-7-oxononanoate synthase [Muribaculaceae bacterium]
MDKLREILSQLEAASNLRTIPFGTAPEKPLIDLSSNDYLGLSENKDLVQKYLDSVDSDVRPGSTASRLLASSQEEYRALETALSEAYGREALMFNSGYHANVGILQSLGDKSTLFVADKLVHASIIDGMSLASVGGARFVRFRHNDFDHLERIMSTQAPSFGRVVIVAESVYSMDGDQTNIDRLVEAKSMHPGALIYLDEAHAVGVVGPAGLGLAASHPRGDKIDIVIGTFGKAFASMGAYAVTSPLIKQYLVNRCRSLIFSTALPPLTVRWSRMAFSYALTADNERERLKTVASKLADILPGQAGTRRSPSHILPLIVGDPASAIRLGAELADVGYKVLPIRTPTVPPGTDRLRFSLSAALAPEDLDGLATFFHTN